MLLPAGGPGDWSVIEEPDPAPVLLQLDVPLLQGLLDGIHQGVEGQVHIAVIFG